MDARRRPTARRSTACRAPRRSCAVAARAARLFAMAVFGTDVDRPLYGRGPSAGLRFTVYAILSIVLMYYDQHGHWVQRLHFALEAAAYPVQVAVSSPRAAWNWLTQSLQTRDALRAENERLHDQVLALEMSVVRQDALEQENAELRGLRAALPPFIKKWQLAEIISVETNPLRQRIVINKGADRRRGGQSGGGRRQRRARPGRPRRALECRGDPGHRSGARDPGRGDAQQPALHCGGLRQYRRAAAALPGGQFRRQERRSAGELGAGRRVSLRPAGGAHQRRAAREPTSCWRRCARSRWRTSSATARWCCCRSSRPHPAAPAPNPPIAPEAAPAPQAGAENRQIRTNDYGTRSAAPP